MAEKHGNLWRPFWKTSTSHGTRPPSARLPTSGANTMMSQFLHPPHPLRHLFQYFHILNILEVHVSQPFDAIPDHLHILQSCWGRSAQHHSQGNPISLSWPPWRTTPPSSPPPPLPRSHATTIEPTLIHRLPGHDPAQEPDPMDMSDSSV